MPGPAVVGATVIMSAAAFSETAAAVAFAAVKVSSVKAFAAVTVAAAAAAGAPRKVAMLMKKSDASARKYGGMGQSGSMPVNEVNAGMRPASEMPAMLLRL